MYQYMLKIRSSGMILCCHANVMMPSLVFYFFLYKWDWAIFDEILYVLQGCYEKVKMYLTEYSLILGGVAFGVPLFLVSDRTKQR